MRDYIGIARFLLGGSPARAAFFLAFWLILYGINSGDLLIGIIAAIIATWASRRLLPGRSSLRVIPLVRLALRFLRQSLVAGVDVAWRAIDPRMPLRPGFVVYQSHFPLGQMQNAFCTITGLLPGTLPAGSDENGDLVIHCLDVRQPVVEQLAAEETALQQVLGGGPND